MCYYHHIFIIVMHKFHHHMLNSIKMLKIGLYKIQSNNCRKLMLILELSGYDILNNINCNQEYIVQHLIKYTCFNICHNFGYNTLYSDLHMGDNCQLNLQHLNIVLFYMSHNLLLLHYIQHNLYRIFGLLFHKYLH